MERISKLLKLLESEVRLSLGSECSHVKFMYGHYFSQSDISKIIGESVAIVSAVGLNKFATVSLIYSPENLGKNKIVLYGEASGTAENVKKVSECFLNGCGIPYVLESEDV